MSSTTAEARPSRVHWLALVVLGLALVYAVVVHFTAPVYPEDDAFIIYRYVDNLVTGKGLVYNQGQKVFGASTPFYVAYLAMLKVLFRSVPTPDLAVRLNFVHYVAFGIGLFLLLRRLLARAGLAALLVALFLVRDDMLRVSTGGMEAFPFSAMMVFSLWALTNRRFVLAAVLAGLSVLARIEGVLLCGVVLVAWLVSLRSGGLMPRAGGRLAVPAGLLLPGMVWIVFGLAYYNTPVYHSIVAKARPVYPLGFGDALFRIFRELEWRILGNLAPWPANGDPVRWRFSILTAVLIFIVVLAVWGHLRRSGRVQPPVPPGRESVIVPATRSWPPPVLLGLFLLLYLVTNPLMFPWYYPPVVALFYVAVVTGVVRRAWSSVQRPVSKVIGRVVTALLVLFFGVTFLRQPAARMLTGRALVDIGVASDPVRTRIVAYREAAEWLNQTLPEGVAIVGPEVGSLGYYYKGPLVDACGLVSPEALPFLPVPQSERFSADCGAISVALVQSLRPDVVVTMGTFAGKSLYSDPWYRRSYVKVRMFELPEPAWNTPTVDVFFRADHVTPQ